MRRLALLPLALLAPLACGGGGPSAAASSGGSTASAGEQPGGAGGQPPVVGGMGGSATGGAGMASGGKGGAPSAGSAGAPAAGGGGAPAGAGGTGGGVTGGSAGAPPTDGGPDAPPDAPLSLLVFSRTTEYRHTSIPNGIAALMTLAGEREWRLTATEDPSAFTDEGLSAFDVIVFLSPSGDVLDDAQQASFERFIRSGKGFAGIHSASTAEYTWAFYGELIGAYFEAHPATQEGTVVVEDATHPATVMLPARWTRTDEWYSFRSNPRPNVHVLLTLDESTYDPMGVGMGADHPIAWTREYEGGRAFYTSLGHTPESYVEPLFLEHVAAGIEWAAGRAP